jgi:hypothetical protein
MKWLLVILVGWGSGIKLLLGIVSLLILGVIFTLLKLAGALNLSWFWALTPFWLIGAGICVCLMLALLNLMLGVFRKGDG